MTSAPMRNDVQPALAPDMIRWNWDGCSGLRRGFVKRSDSFRGLLQYSHAAATVRLAYDP
jgi:hypothetical protein